MWRLWALETWTTKAERGEAGRAREVLETSLAGIGCLICYVLVSPRHRELTDSCPGIFFL